MNHSLKACNFFFSLPNEVRDKIKIFLTSQEWRKLLNICQKQEKKKEKIQEADFYYLKKILYDMKSSGLAAKSNLLSNIYISIFLLFTCFSLLKAEYSVSIYLFLYSIFGYICIKRKSQTYWNLHFFRSKFEPSFFLLSGYVYVLLLLLIGYNTVSAESVSDWGHQPEISFILQACLLGPIFEEIFFRGYIFEISSISSGNNKSGEYNGIWISSLLFAIAHLQDIQIEALLKTLTLFFSAGVLLACLRWYTRSLLYGSVVHIAFNSTTLLIL